jgi:hypothetical protein
MLLAAINIVISGWQILPFFLATIVVGFVLGFLVARDRWDI